MLVRAQALNRDEADRLLVEKLDAGLHAGFGVMEGCEPGEAWPGERPIVMWQEPDDGCGVCGGSGIRCCEFGADR